jgi:hypothetical protein
MGNTRRLALLALLLVLPAILGCETLSQFTTQEYEEYWTGKSFTARWSEPIPGGPLNFDGTISGCSASYEIGRATARVHGPLGGGADIDMKGEYPPPVVEGEDMVPLVPVAPLETPAFKSPIRIYEFDLELKGALTGLRCPCTINHVLHMQVEIDLAARNAWIRQARAPTGDITCQCEQGEFLKSLIPVKYPDNVIIELVAVDDPACNPSR